MKGKLYLIPATLGDSPIENVIPGNVQQIINSIKYYIVENERTARRYLLKLGIKTPIDKLTFFILNKHTDSKEIANFLSPVLNGEDIGILSEAGVPAVADPGSEIVSLAHEKNIQVVPLVGPSSILMALMASGMNGQNFAFIGYLPIKNPARINKIKEIEKRSFAEKQTQIFIEAPYRNQKLLEDIVNTCNSNTLLTVACNISLENEFVKTKPVKEWRKKMPDINKKPGIFLIYKH